MLPCVRCVPWFHALGRQKRISGRSTAVPRRSQHGDRLEECQPTVGGDSTPATRRRLGLATLVPFCNASRQAGQQTDRQNFSASSRCTWFARGLATHHVSLSRVTCWLLRMILPILPVSVLQNIAPIVRIHTHLWMRILPSLEHTKPQCFWRPSETRKTTRFGQRDA